jgi:[ribosomal protein S5]-alanine N-acetyltransferase
MIITVTRDIHLSAIIAPDAHDLATHLQDPDVNQHMLLLPQPYTLELAKKWIDHAAGDVQRNGRQTIWAIRETSGRMIGEIVLHAGSPAREHASDLGYWLAKSYWRRGIMTAVIQTMIEYAFREFGVQRITAPIFVQNIASARVLEKNGFIVEASLMRRAYQRNGQFYDARLYALVRD